MCNYRIFLSGHVKDYGMDYGIACGRAFRMIKITLFFSLYPTVVGLAYIDIYQTSQSDTIGSQGATLFFTPAHTLTPPAHILSHHQLILSHH
jgi:hypothetical protein